MLGCVVSLEQWKDKVRGCSCPTFLQWREEWDLCPSIFRLYQALSLCYWKGWYFFLYLLNSFLLQLQTHLLQETCSSKVGRGVDPCSSVLILRHIYLRFDLVYMFGVLGVWGYRDPPLLCEAECRTCLLCLRTAKRSWVSKITEWVNIGSKQRAIWPKILLSDLLLFWYLSKLHVHVWASVDLSPISWGSFPEWDGNAKRHVWYHLGTGTEA